MRTFWLEREHDVSGVSGTGKVAEGVEWVRGGSVALRWCAGGPESISIWPNLKDMVAVHGHNGATVVHFYDNGGVGSAGW